MAFTSVSFRDPNVDAKVFVRRYPHGTGSYRSCMDCVKQRSRYRLQCIWSLDGEFLDDKDPEWMFWQREAEYKWRLYSDYGGRRHPNSTAAQESSRTKAPGSNQETYSRQRFSIRVGSLIPESNQALNNTKRDWLEMAREQNFGPLLR